MACTGMGLAQITFAFGSETLLFVGIVIMGFSYGSIFCLSPSWVSEAFGLQSFGATFGFLGLAPAIGSEVLSTNIAGRFADEYRRHHFVNVTTADGTAALHCLGIGCFENAMLINTAACGIAVICATWLAFRQSNLTADTVIVLKRRIV